MAVQPGQTLSHYRIVDKLGEGGMGVVWKAVDTSLDREAAIKVLPDAFATDPERLARFQREAKLLASLNHPNIASIHGLEEASSADSAQAVRFLALELVPGDSLAVVLGRGALPIDDALRLARQIAAALEAAHESGVVHRDIKPGNIQITPAGQVKVLDFGLAKSAMPDAEDLSESPTLTAEFTQAGAIMGTAGYMSPEQAKGRPVDRRADTWAFGCVLYEMLAGKRAFDGKTFAETMARVLEREPDWDALPARLPARIRRLVRRCMAKDITRRLQAIGDARVVLDEWLESPSAPDEETMIPRSPTWRSAAPWLLLPLALTAAWFLKPKPRQTSSRPVQFEVLLPAGFNQDQPEESRLKHEYRRGVAVSPDGRMIAFVSGTGDRGSGQIHLRLLDEWDSRPVPGTEHGLQPVFSPDGDWLAFAVQSDGARAAGAPTPEWSLMKVPIAGGAPVKICDYWLPYGASWGPDDMIVLGSYDQGLRQVFAQGGAPEALTQLDLEAGESGHRLPHWLPDGEAVVYTAIRGKTGSSVDWAAAGIFAFSPETGERKLLAEGASDARYLPTGHLLFAREGQLLAVPFDRSRLEVTGREVPVLEAVNHAIHNSSTVNDTGVAHYDVSSTGTLVYAPGSVHPEDTTRPVWVDRQGQKELLEVEPRQYWWGRVSPDGSQVLLTVNYPPGDAWIFDRERKTLRRQTFEGISSAAVWGPGPDRITFPRAGGIYAKTIDTGPGDAQMLTESGLRAGSWAPDGERLLFLDGETSWDLWTLDEGGNADLFLGTEFDESYPEFSPDGRWAVYASDESGKSEVYVRPYPPVRGPADQISVDGGGMPVWSRDGREIFYRANRGQIYAVPIDSSGDRLRAGQPVRVGGGMYLRWGPIRSWDVAPDGRFLLIMQPEDSTLEENHAKVHPDRIRVVPDWFAELRERAPSTP